MGLSSIVGKAESSRIKPRHKILDNEASKEYKTTIKENGMMYKLVPPDMQRPNRAETSIQMFKDHFVMILSGVDASFPMNLWDQLLPQGEMMVNLLRQANVAQKCWHMHT